jgi:serine/threonine protein kinase
MAPESISQQTYSKKSDVWTFGIVVWEIVCQREPHTNVNPVEVGILIRDRYLTPTIPNNCPQKLRQVMELCWQKQPDQRPGFETICAMLQ